jgi:quercetin dioxygenase-like cupin family protein
MTQIRKLSEISGEKVKGHEGFIARSLVDLPGKGVSVRLLNVAPGGVGPVPAHSHRDTHFFLVLDGTLELEIDGQAQLIQTGCCIEVPPGRTHQLRCAGEKEMVVLAIKWD